AAAGLLFAGNRHLAMEIDPEPSRSSLLARESSPSAPSHDLTPRHTFQSFVIGPSNQFAQAVCQPLPGSPGPVYNPVFLYGGVGLGKTHLLHAVGHEMGRRYP